MRKRRGLRGAGTGLRLVDDALDSGLCGSAVGALVSYAQTGDHSKAVVADATRKVVSCFSRRR